MDDKSIDAVTVSTADHCHAPASVAAMRAGKHVYCEKPLAHSVHEARVMRETFAKSGVATQMGTQIHANDNYRRGLSFLSSRMMLRSPWRFSSIFALACLPW